MFERDTVCYIGTDYFCLSSIDLFDKQTTEKLESVETGKEARKVRWVEQQLELQSKVSYWIKIIITGHGCY